MISPVAAMTQAEKGDAENGKEKGGEKEKEQRGVKRPIVPALVPESLQEVGCPGRVWNWACARQGAHCRAGARSLAEEGRAGCCRKGSGPALDCPRAWWVVRGGEAAHLGAMGDAERGGAGGSARAPRPALHPPTGTPAGPRPASPARARRLWLHLLPSRWARWVPGV